MPKDRALIPLIARHIGCPEPAADWQGVDAVMPILEKIKSEGSIVLLKLDGERGPGDTGLYTALVSGKASMASTFESTRTLPKMRSAM